MTLRTNMGLPSPIDGSSPAPEADGDKGLQVALGFARLLNIARQMLHAIRYGAHMPTDIAEFEKRCHAEAGPIVDMKTAIPELPKVGRYQAMDLKRMDFEVTHVRISSMLSRSDLTAWEREHINVLLQYSAQLLYSNVPARDTGT